MGILMAKKKAKVTAKAKKKSYILRLYITSNTQKSNHAVDNIKRICETHLKGQYDLEVIDIYKHPELAKGEQIIAVPTLIKFLPSPLKKLIGDLSNEEKVLLCLDIKPLKKKSVRGSDGS